MATYDIKTLQSALLESFKEMDSVFRQHNLRYFLVSGTMLGAVRHKGFIPWDDDIDIAMPRKDYELLLKNHKEWLPAHLEFICGEEDSNYPLPYGKIQDARTTVIEKTYRDYVGGIFVDIFPLDGVPNPGTFAHWMHFARFRFWRKIIYFVYRDPFKHGKSLNSIVPLLCQKLIGKERAQRKIRQVLMESDYEKSAYVSEHYCRNIFTIKKEVFGTPTLYDYEDTSLYGVEQADKYLTIEYGNYMQLPPENKRQQHNFHFLNLNMPYREYANTDKANQ